MPDRIASFATRLAMTAGCGRVKGNDPLILTQKSDEFALHRNLIRSEDAGLVGRVLSFQCDGIVPLAQALEGDFMSFDQCHDN